MLKPAFLSIILEWHYIGVIGWIGNKPQKIYTSDAFENFFLYDELTDRLFELNITDRLAWKDPGEYDKVVQAYLSSMTAH